jgi:hypothetical protein
MTHNRTSALRTWQIALGVLGISIAVAAVTLWLPARLGGRAKPVTVIAYAMTDGRRELTCRAEAEGVEALRDAEACVLACERHGFRSKRLTSGIMRTVITDHEVDELIAKRPEMLPAECRP